LFKEGMKTIVKACHVFPNKGTIKKEILEFKKEIESPLTIPKIDRT
jgi:hypothetical protein